MTAADAMRDGDMRRIVPTVRVAVFAATHCPAAGGGVAATADPPPAMTHHLQQVK